jgi:hypothetical protein
MKYVGLVGCTEGAVWAQPAPCSLRRRHKLRTYLDNL